MFASSISALPRFGILPNCTHCFCLPCIRKWRQAKQFEHKIIRACPECRHCEYCFPSRQLFAFFWFWSNVFGCRQTSDYICPSRFWVETTEEKGRLLTDYKVISFLGPWSFLYKNHPMVSCLSYYQTKITASPKKYYQFFASEKPGSKGVQVLQQGGGRMPIW